MADVVDDFGRVTRLKEDFDSLSESLRSAVGKAVEYAAGRAKENTDDLKGEFEKLVEAMEELGEDVKDSLKSTKDFVEEVKRAAESVEKARASKAAGVKDTLADAQREQTRILQQILQLQQKAISEKAAKFTTGGTTLSSPPARRPALKEMGFRPRGADKIPAMVSPGEFVVSKKGAMGNEHLLDRINRGYVRGGKVKPEYLASGSTKGVWEGMTYEIINRSGRKVILIDGVLDQKSAKRLQEDFAHLGDKISVEFAESFNDRLRETTAVWFTSMAAAFTGRGDPFQVLFEGVVKDITDFRREMRNLAFQTEGITGNFREAQAEFARIGKDIAGRTGVTVTAFQKAYMNNARKGFKDQKAGMKVLEAGLQLSTMIGSETQATAGIFAEWHRELGLSSIQMEKMATDMRSVALSTGVTGDELINAMKSSDGILKNLRNQGTLTSNVAKSVVTMMAEAQKTGYGESTNKILTALSSHSGMMSADSSTQALLYSVANRMGGGATREMLTGNFMKSRENLSGFATNMKDMVGGLIGKKGSDLDFSKITDQERDLLAMRLRAYGIEIGEAESLIKTTEKASKGLRGTMDDLDKIAASEFSTEEEKKLAEKKRSDAFLGASMDFLSGVRDKTGDQSLAEAMAGLSDSKDFANQRQDFAAMASALTPAMMSQFGLGGSKEEMSAQMANMSVQKQTELSSLIAADQLMKAAKAQGRSVKNFGPEMQAALAKGDTKRFNELRDEMQGEFSKIGVADAANVDPMEALEQSMNELNETIRSAFSPLTGAVLDLIGWIGLVGMQIGLMSGALSRFFGGSFVQLLAGGGPGGGLANALDNYARKTAASADVSEGIFKKFLSTYASSRQGGFSGTGAFGRGGTIAPKGVFSSLNDAFGSVRDDMLKGMSKMRGATVEFFQAAYQNSGRFFGAFTKGFNRGLKSGGGFFSSIQRGFSTSMKSFDFTRVILHKMGDGLKLVNGKYVQTLASIRKTSPALAGFVRSSVELGKSFMTLNFGAIFKNFGRTMKSGFQVFKNAFNPASWKTLFSGGLKGIKGAVLGGSLGTAQIIFSAIDMVFGAVSGFMNTGKRFEGVMKAMGKSTNDMTWGMYASSTITGALVGILDGLTFGLLRFSGAAEFLEQTLSFVLYTVFSFVEGIVEGILYPFRMVWNAIKYIGAQFKGIGDSILSVFNAIAGIFGAEAGNWSEAFAMVYPWLKAIGRVIGYVVGMPLAGMLWLLVKGISAALVPLQMLIGAITGVIKVLAGFVKFFVDIFRVGLWQATKNLAWTVFEAVLGIFRPITDFLWSLMGDILAPFEWLANILCWNSIVPDMVMEIVKWFAMLPVRIFGFLVKIPLMLGKALLSIPSVIGDMYSKVGSYLEGFGTDNIFSAILSQIGNLYSFIGGTIKNLVGVASGVLSVIQGILTLDFGVIWDGLSQIGSSIVAQLSNVGSFFYKTLNNAGSFLFKMLKKIPTMLIRGMKAVFFEFPSWLVGKLMDGIWAVGNFLFLTLPNMMWDGFKNTVSSIKNAIWDTIWWPFKKLGELLEAVFYDFPIWLGTKLMEGLQAVFYDLPMWLGKTIWDGMASIAAGIPGALYGALHSAASAIGLGWLVEKLGGGKPSAAGDKKAGSAQATAAGGAGSLLTGVAAIGAAVVGFRRLPSLISGVASTAFKYIGSFVPKDIGKHASTAFGFIKENAKSLFQSKSIREAAVKAFDLFKKVTPTGILKMATGAFDMVKRFVPSGITKAVANTVGMAKRLATGKAAAEAAKANPFASMGGGMGQQAAKTAAARAAAEAAKANPFASMGGSMGKQAMKTSAGSSNHKLFGDTFFKKFKEKGVFSNKSTKLIEDTFKSTKAKGLLGRASGALGKVGGLLGKAGTSAINLMGKSGGLFGKAGGMVTGLAGKTGGKVMNLASKGAGLIGGLFGNTVKIGSKIAETMGKGGGVIGGLFGKAGGFLAKAGLGGMGKSLLKKLPGIGAVAGAGFAIASLVNGDIGGALTNLASGLAGSIPLIGPVLSAGIDMFGGSLAEGAGWIANKAFEGAKNIGAKALEGAKWLGSKAWDGVQWLGSKAWEGLKSAGSWISSWFGGGENENENKEEKLASMAMAKIEAQTVVLSTSVGQHAIPAAKPGDGTPATDVEPVHLRDITGTILRDRASSGGNKLQSDELARMEEASNRQVSELEQIRQGIQELVSLMRPRGGVVGSGEDSGAARTKDPRRPMHAAKFGKMKYGKMGGSPNRSFVNNGEV